MSGWDRSMLLMSAKELDVQDALTALRRLLDGRSLRATTRVILDGARLALEAELALEQELGPPALRAPAGAGYGRTAAPK
jgi:hypothetical protein